MSRIEIRNLSKQFGSTAALNDVTTSLSEGKIHGLLGRNGAGKTTLINIITNKLFPSSGGVFIDGENAVENDRVQSRIFCMNEKSVYPPDMKVKDVFRWTREFFPSFDMDYARSLAEKFNLETGKRVKALSTGYHSIAKLVATLASGAPVLIFDEPVLGLDANHRERFYRELVARYSEQPSTILISTHLIDEVAQILEEVIILRDGEVIVAEQLENVLAMGYTVSGAGKTVDDYALGKNVIREESIGAFKAITIFQRRDKADKEAARKLGLEITPARLQEIFISLTETNHQEGNHELR